MNDLHVLFFITCVIALIWGLRLRKTKRAADEEMVECEFPSCGRRAQRQEMQWVIANDERRLWCPKCAGPRPEKWRP